MLWFKATALNGKEYEFTFEDIGAICKDKGMFYIANQPKEIECLIESVQVVSKIENKGNTESALDKDNSFGKENNEYYNEILKRVEEVKGMCIKKQGTQFKVENIRYSGKANNFKRYLLRSYIDDQQVSQIKKQCLNEGYNVEIEWRDIYQSSSGHGLFIYLSYTPKW